MTPPKTPTLDKLSRVSKESQRIGDFLEWLKEQGIELCSIHECGKDCSKRRCEHFEQYVPAVVRSQEEKVAERLAGQALKTARTTEAVLATYFGIDLDKVEEERRALLDYVREQQKGKA